MNTNKRKRHIVLVDPDNEADVVINEGDRLVVQQILSNAGIDKRVGIQKNDKERRVAYLYLEGSKITTLPPSIGRLEDLQYLDLSATEKLVNLPEEIGDLANLNKLDLQRSGITSLPPSIGRLKNLQVLNLSSAKELVNLPEEIGNLTSLCSLSLYGSNITSLPPSIGRLKNLQVLNLMCTEELVNLPEEIGDLTSLTNLNLLYSNITSLPSSIGRLRNLKDLIVRIRSKFPIITKTLCYEMSCHKARLRIGLGTVHEDSVSMPSKLWPLVLHNATRAFDNSYDIYNIPRIGRLRDAQGPFDNGYDTSDLKQPDYIHQLLMDGRESFLQVLLNRDSNTGI